MRRSQENRVFLEGNVTRDSNVVINGDNKARLAFSIASTEYGPGEKKYVAFADVIAFGGLAERIKGLKKGDLVYIVGKLHYDSWERDGKKTNKLEIIAFKILFQDTAFEDSSYSGGEEEVPF